MDASTSSDGSKLSVDVHGGAGEVVEFIVLLPRRAGSQSQSWEVRVVQATIPAAGGSVRVVVGK